MAIKIDGMRSPMLEPIITDAVSVAGLELKVLRLDRVHPVVSGNKWYKLKRNIEAAVLSKKSGILTFGGKWSNHLVATAAAAQLLRFKSVGLVRDLPGNEGGYTLSLQECNRYGMELAGLSRTEYRQKYNPEFLEALRIKYPDFYIVPEGGNNELGVEGCLEIAEVIPADTDFVITSVGTGSTFAGIRKGLPRSVKVFGFGPFRSLEEQQQTIHNYCPEEDWSGDRLFPDTVWGGFGKYDLRLLNFMNALYLEAGVATDLVYTGKMFYYLKRMIEEGGFPRGSRLVAIHTGGLQGNRSVEEQLRF